MDICCYGYWTFCMQEAHVHALTLPSPTLEPYLHLWGMITFVTLEVIFDINLNSILTTLSGMVGGVVPPAPAAVSTPHHGSVKNYPSPPPTILRSGYVPIRLLTTKMSKLKQLNCIFSERTLAVRT